MSNEISVINFGDGNGYGGGFGDGRGDGRGYGDGNGFGNGRGDGTGNGDGNLIDDLLVLKGDLDYSFPIENAFLTCEFKDLPLYVNTEIKGMKEIVLKRLSGDL